MAKISVNGMYVIAKSVVFNRDANGMHYRPVLALQKHLSRSSSPILYPDRYRIVFEKKTFLITDIPGMAGSGINHGDTFGIVFQIDPELYYQKMAGGVIEAAKMDLWYLVRWFEMTPEDAKDLDVEVAQDDEMTLDDLNSVLQDWGVAPVPHPRTFNW